MIGEKQFNHAVSDLRRFRQVVGVLIDEGLGLVIDDMHLGYLRTMGARLRQSSRKQKQAKVPAQVRLRRALERLGPTYIKFGQIMSTRSDLLPAGFINELSKLQDRVHAVPAKAVRHQVEKELGRPIAELFEKFEGRPTAAASLAQVHRARLKDGTAVAVKVRRPGIERTIRTDIRILLHLAGLMEKRLAWSRRYRPVRLAREFADWTQRELDFEHEAANIVRFAAAFGQDEQVVLPEVFWDLTTSAVLTASLIEGVRVDDFEALEAQGIDAHELGRLGLRVGFRQFLQYGFFHADPHPGNLVALPPEKAGGLPRLGIYDFGMVGQLSEKVRFDMIGCFAAFADKDIERYVDHVIRLAESTEGADLESFSKEAAAMLTAVFWKPNQHKRVGQAFYEVVMSAARNGILFSRELVLVGKAMITLENVGLALYPDIDLEAEVKPFLKEVYRREFDPRHLVKEAASQSLDNLYSIKHLPEEARRAVDRLARGEMGVKIDLEELRGLKEEFDRQNDIRVTAIMSAAVLLASALALPNGGTIGLLAKGGFVIALFLTAWTFYLVSQRPKI